MHLLQQLQDKNIAIRGYGKEGQATYNFLIEKGINPKNITIIDKKRNKNVPTQSNFLIESKNTERESYDHIIKSAGISLYQKELTKLQPKIITATQIFFHYNKVRIIAITGTKGKTTITQLIYNLLKNAGYKVQIAGNIGLPLLAQCDPIQPRYEYIICELSSYMLDHLQPDTYISILNNLYHEHHVQRHGSLKEYRNTKTNILTNAQYKIVSTQAIQVLQEKKLWQEKRNQDIHMFGDKNGHYYENGTFYNKNHKLFDDTNLHISGEHNRQNMSSVCATAEQLNIDMQIVKQTREDFHGIEHRIEYVGQYGGIHRYNDAIATTPEATIEAIKGMKKPVDTIFLGGSDGGYNFSTLTKIIEKHKIKNVILFSNTGKKIKELLTKQKQQYRFCDAKTMQQAVAFAYEHTQKDAIALLSCASPSYSLRENFEEKGRLFKKHVKNRA